MDEAVIDRQLGLRFQGLLVLSDCIRLLWAVRVPELPWGTGLL